LAAAYTKQIDSKKISMTTMTSNVYILMFQEDKMSIYNARITTIIVPRAAILGEGGGTSSRRNYGGCHWQRTLQT
jgi:hypothetical protein